MALKAGIVGLPNVGKSTLFNALTAAGAASANYPFCTIEPNVGVVAVPDPRLAQIQSKIKTQKVIPASVEIVDIAGLVKGASKGEGLGNQFLGNIRNTDAILQVVRCFEDEDITHVDGSVNPLRDIETIGLELIFADLDSAEKRLDKWSKVAKSGDKDAIKQRDMLTKVVALLEAGKPARAGEWSEDERLLMKSGGFITLKPVLFVCNVDEDGLGEDNAHVQAVRKHASEVDAGVVVLCASIEADISELEEEEDRKEFLTDMGLEEPGLAVLARGTYELLGLRTYFTAGEKEIRAWTIHEGDTAPQAAGVIHTDFQKGFIRAEVYTLPDLLEHGSEAALKATGKLRVEGKEYVVADGDILHFRFNV